MVGRIVVFEYFFGISQLESQELQSLNGVKGFGDFEVKRSDNWLFPWLDWPIERVWDSSEALRIKRRSLFELGESSADELEGEFREHLL